MSTLSRIQIGAASETTYGTATTVTRFYEVVSDNVTPRHGRVQSRGMASGRRVPSSQRGAVYVLGADGTVEMEVLSKGFGFWLTHMVGAVATTGPTNSRYTHTGTIGELRGDSFTYQSNRPTTSADADLPMTFEGGKIKSWRLSCETEGLLMASFDMDFETYSLATGLASVSYPSAMENFSFAGGTVTVAGTQFDINSVEIGVDNMLNVDRRFIRGNALKKEPLENDFRAITWSLSEADFDDTSAFAYFASATLGGAHAALVATWIAPTAISGTTYPEVVVTVDEAFFETWEGATIEGPGTLKQTINGTGHFDHTNAPLSIEYKTADSTP